MTSLFVYVRICQEIHDQPWNMLTYYKISHNCLEVGVFYYKFIIFLPYSYVYEWGVTSNLCMTFFSYTTFIHPSSDIITKGKVSRLSSCNFAHHYPSGPKTSKCHKKERGWEREMEGNSKDGKVTFITLKENVTFITLNFRDRRSIFRT